MEWVPQLDRVRSACGTTHVARLEFPRETGLILRCFFFFKHQNQFVFGYNRLRVLRQFHSKVRSSKVSR